MNHVRWQLSAVLSGAISLICLSVVVASAISHHPTPWAATAAAVHAPGPGPVHVVGLGDSVPSGSACGCTSYVDLVGRAVAERTGRQVAVDNLAQDGATSDDLLGQLGNAGTRSTLSGADVVIVTVGANDFSADALDAQGCRAALVVACSRSALEALRQRMSAILQQTHALLGPTGQLLVTGYWNIFLDGAVGRALGPDYVQGSDALTRAANHVIEDAAGRTGSTYVDLYRPFKGDGSGDCTRLLASDGDHPDSAGHEVIAAAVDQRLLID